jgi:hypothetical protein
MVAPEIDRRIFFKVIFFVVNLLEQLPKTKIPMKIIQCVSIIFERRSQSRKANFMRRKNQKRRLKQQPSKYYFTSRFI